MNAGRDVERLIAGWLEEEAEAGAPVRVLESIRLSIDRTRQRRWIAAWREPVFISPLRLAGMAGLLIIAVAGGAFIGRATAPGGAGSPATPAPTTDSSGGGVTLDAYRVGWTAICNRYSAAVNPLKPDLEGIHDAETTAENRAAKARTLLDMVTQFESMTAELAGLEPPRELAAEHAAFVARSQDANLLIREVLARLAAGDLEGAASVDAAINVLNVPMTAFQSDNRLDGCP